MDARHPAETLDPELVARALRCWLEGLPPEVQYLLAREARVHVPRRSRGNLPGLLLEHWRRSPYARLVLEKWWERAHAGLLQELRAFAGPLVPDGVELVRRLREEHGLDLPALAWLLSLAGNPALTGAGAEAFPDEWRQVAAAAAEAPAPEPAGPPAAGGEETRRLHKLLREREEEVRRLQAALARHEKELASLGHRLEQAQRRLAEETARRAALQAELAEARQAARSAEQAERARAAEQVAAALREKQALQDQLAAAQRALREKDEALQEAHRRLRRTRLEALRWQVMYLTLDAYLDLAVPREGRLAPEAFLAYSRLLDRYEADVILQMGPGNARELAPRVAAVQVAREVHAALSRYALTFPDPVPRPAAAAEAAGVLCREGDRYYVRLPDRYQPIDPAAVAALGAFPGDVVAVELRGEVQPAGAHFYPFYHLREAQPRVEEIAMVQSGPPWVVATSRGPLPLLGAGERRLEAGQPVVVAFPQQGAEACLLVRVLEYDGEAGVRLPALRRPEARADGQREAGQEEPPARQKAPLLEGRTIYILGGEGFEAHYRQVVESYGGRLLWTSGFGELRQIEHRVRQADAVVLVTRGVSHKAFDHLQAALASTGRPLFYCNALGHSQLERVLEQEVIPALAGKAARG